MKLKLKLPPTKNKPSLIKTSFTRLALLAMSGLIAASTMKAGAATFTAGDLAVFLAADSSANNTTFSIVELNTNTASQTAVQTIAINGTTGGTALRISGSATSTGYLADSDDGTLLAFDGHNSITTGVNANTILARGVGTLNNAGAFSLAATYTSTSGSQARGATTINNSLFYIADQNGVYTNGNTSALISANVRSIKSFGGTLYVLQNSSTVTTLVVSTLSADGKTVTGLTGLANDSTAQDFYLVSSGNNGSTYDVLYVLTTAGIKKYSLAGATWTANASYATVTGFGLCAARSGSGAVLYVTTGSGATAANNLVKVTDNAGFNASISVTTANNVILYTATAPTTMKGVAFAPQAAQVAQKTTTTSLVSSANPSTYNQSVTFTASLQTNGVTAASATSNYIFKVDGTAVATNAVASGQATYITSTLTATSHIITAGYVGDANYAASTNTLTQTVNTATPFVETVPSATAITYGQTLADSVLSGGSATNAQGTTVTGSFAFTTPSNAPNAGNANAAVTFTAANTNYNTASTTVSVAVSQVPLTITANSAGKTYDGVGYLGGNGVSYSGFVNGETPAVLGGTLAYGGASQGAIGAGTYPIIPTGLTSANYAINFLNGHLTVAPLGVTVMADAKTKVYGSAEPTLTYQFAPALVSGDSFSGALSRAAGESVGGYAISQGSLGLSANYALAYVGASLAITPADLTVTANNAGKVYGQTLTLAGTEFTTSGLTNGDSVASVTLASGGLTNTAAVGSHPIVASAATGTDLGNYAIRYVDGTLTVTEGTPVSISSPLVLPDGSIQLIFTGGDAGVSYRIQASTDLSTTAWITLTTTAAGTNGLSSFNDLDSTNHPARFYRTVTP
ncbi:MAG: hypothetical protein JWR26_2784 [Pedosphaera sp.]|nr:hypothetical protein [Pedosphaera sp.]